MYTTYIFMDFFCFQTPMVIIVQIYLAQSTKKILEKMEECNYLKNISGWNPSLVVGRLLNTKEYSESSLRPQEDVCESKDDDDDDVMTGSYKRRGSADGLLGSADDCLESADDLQESADDHQESAVSRRGSADRILEPRGSNKRQDGKRPYPSNCLSDNNEPEEARSDDEKEEVDDEAKDEDSKKLDLDDRNNELAVKLSDDDLEELEQDEADEPGAAESDKDELKLSDSEEEDDGEEKDVGEEKGNKAARQ